nr:hypothetical protein HK105_002878 [Polyrhizophydium stewartii]
MTSAPLCDMSAAAADQFQVSSLEAARIPKKPSTAAVTINTPRGAMQLVALSTGPAGGSSTSGSDAAVEAGEMLDLVCLHPSDARRAVVASSRPFDRLFHLTYADRVDPAALDAALAEAGDEVLVRPYVPRTHPDGLKLQSPPFGFDADERVLRETLGGRNIPSAAASSQKHKDKKDKSKADAVLAPASAATGKASKKKEAKAAAAAAATSAAAPTATPTEKKPRKSKSKE